MVEFPLRKKITKPNWISNKNISSYSLNKGDTSTGWIYNQKEMFRAFEIHSFFFIVMEFRTLIVMLSFLSFLVRKDLSIYERGIFLLICLICLGISEMNYFNHLLSISKNPYLAFPESLPAIFRILTVDSPNAYHWWLYLWKSRFDYTDIVKCDGDFFLKTRFSYLVTEYNISNSNRYNKIAHLDDEALKIKAVCVASDTCKSYWHSHSKLIFPHQIK